MKKLVKWSLGIIFALIVAVIAGGYIFIRTFDLNKYKLHLQNLVYQQTGRQLTLNGDAGLKISLIPTVVLNDVALSNAPWAEEKDMIKAQSVEVSLALLPLLHKEIVIDTINLVKPQIFLAVDVNGVGNWEFSKPEKNTIQTAGSAAKNWLIPAAYAAPLPENSAKETLPLSIVAKNLQIQQGLVTYDDMKAGRITKIGINMLKLTTVGSNNDIKLDFEINYNGDNIAGTATAGSLDALLQKAEKYPVNADIEALGIKLQTELMLKNLSRDFAFSGYVKAQNPAGNFGMPSVNADTEISGNFEEITVFLKSLNIAGNTIGGKISVDLKSSKPFISADLQSPRIDVRTFSQKMQKQAALSFVPVAYAAQFVPATPVNFQILNSIDANLNASVDTLIVDNNLKADNVHVTAVLDKGLLTLQPVQAGIAGGTLRGILRLNANDNRMNVDVTGNALVLQNLLPELAVLDNKNFGIISGGNTEIKISLQGQGTTIRQIVESLNGQVIAVLGESKVRIGTLKYLSGNFVTQLLSMLHLEQMQTNMSLKCAVVRADITNGSLLFPKGLVFNAKQMTIVSDGSVNLKNDKINFTIHPFSGKITDTNVAQALSSLIKVTGTVQKPKLSLDNTSVIKNVVGIAAAGPAFLGSQMLLDIDDSPCYTALKGTPYQDMFPVSSGIKSTGQDVYRGANDAVSTGVDVLKNTAKDVFNLLKRK